MNTILYIDTTNNSLTIVEIRQKDKTHTFSEKTDHMTKSQNILSLIQKALRTQKVTFQDILAIEVNPGPGSFTGSRVGVSVANALGWVLEVSINGKKQELPKYTESKFDEPKD